MTREELDLVMKTLQLKADKEGNWTMPEESSATVYVAHDGASMSVSKVSSIRAEGEMLFLRTQKKETFAIARADVFVIAADGAAGGQPARRPAGFSG